MEDNGFIGDIRYSILEPGIFTQLHPDWVLLKGQDPDKENPDVDDLKFKDSQLAKLVRAALPDARGVFLRGVHLSRADGKGDAEGDGRQALSYQADEFKSHNHGGGNHGHAWQGASTIDTWGGNVVVGGNGIGQKGVPPSGVIINTEGGKETRPQNISVYIYIKIN